MHHHLRERDLNALLHEERPNVPSELALRLEDIFFPEMCQRIRPLDTPIP